MSCLKMKGHWFDIIVLNVHATPEAQSYDKRDSFYEELEHVFDQFTMYHMKIFNMRFQCSSRDRLYFQTCNWE